MENGSDQRKLAAILSGDVVGYSRLMTHDEEATVRALGVCREDVSARVSEHRGRLADFTGDAFLAEFPTALDAVRCAIEIQKSSRARNADVPADRRMLLRIGAHLGDVRTDGERLFGDGVNIAARLESLADPGGVAISRTVHEQVRRRLDLAFEDLGDHALKNIPEPVGVYRVRLEGSRARMGVPTRRRLVRGAALAVVVFAALAAWRWIEIPPATDAPHQIRTLAVLPLENLSGDPAQEYFSDGMTEALIAGLSEIKSLGVISRTSVMRYKGTEQPLREIAQALGVDAVVEGSVFRAGDSVRITAQLIDARDDQHLWSASYERELQDVLQIQAEVSQAIAEEIEVAFASDHWERYSRVDPRAHEAFLQGVYFFAKGNAGSPADLKKSEQYCKQAIEIDATYAPAYAILAAAYS